MALNKDDVSKIGYQAKVDWYKERFTAITSTDMLVEEVKEEVLTPDELIDILNDIHKKTSKLEGRIDFLSMELKIPIDKEKQPVVAQAVAQLDKESEGEYLSYSLYLRLLKQQELALANLKLEDIIDNVTGDISSDSLFIQDRLFTGLSQYTESRPDVMPEDNALERYVNRYMNNVFSWNEHDYNIRQIINFADTYLDTYPGLKYIPWTVRREVGQERVDVKGLSEFWQAFSHKFVTKSNELLGGVKNLAILRPDKRISGLTKRYIDYTNNFLNAINDTFDMDYGSDLICCFVRWSGSLDIKTLKGLRALMQLFRAGLILDFSDIFNGLKDIVNNIFRGLLTHKLIGFVHQIFQRLVDPFKKWINDPDPKWQKIFICTPVDEFINKFVIGSLEYIESLLESLIKNWYKQIELKNLKLDLRISVLKEQKGLGIFIRMLDVVISALERSAICGTESSPTGEEIQKMMHAYGLGPEEPYKYLVEENPNEYNSFIPKKGEKISEESLGGSISTKFDTKIKTSGITESKSRFDECLKKIIPEDVLKVSEWMEEINAKSQEKA